MIIITINIPYYNIHYYSEEQIIDTTISDEFVVIIKFEDKFEIDIS